MSTYTGNISKLKNVCLYVRDKTYIYGWYHGTNTYIQYKISTCMNIIYGIPQKRHMHGLFKFYQCNSYRNWKQYNILNAPALLTTIADSVRSLPLPHYFEVFSCLYMYMGNWSILLCNIPGNNGSPNISVLENLNEYQ